MLYVGISILIIILFLGVGYYFYQLSIKPNVFNHKDSYKIELDNDYFEEEWYQGLEREEVTINSSYGYELYGEYYENNSDKTVIICHGYTYTLMGSLKYATLFLERGFNVLVYDHRYHGKSSGPDCTFGYYEKNDLKTVIDWVYENKGMHLIGTHGESMGAATVIQHSAIDDRISFVVADCPFDDLYNQFKYRMRVEYKLPGFPILQAASVVSKIKSNFLFSQVSPVKAIQKSEVPMLIIHGDEDAFIPKSHSENLYNAKKDKKMLYLMPKADHAESYKANRVKYGELLDEFIAKYVEV